MAVYLDEICRFAAEMSYAKLPLEVIVRAKEIMADTVAVIAAGAQEQEMKALTRRLLQSAPKGAATLLGDGRKADVFNTALLNGSAGTFLELDEGNQFARGHPAVHIVPAVLAFGEQQGLGGRALILALTIGYELSARVGIASKIRMTMHPHGTWGTIGAATAVGRLAGLDQARFKELINISSSLGLTTSRKTMLEGGTIRNVYSGASNYLGLLALNLVLSGFSGEADGLSTVYGSVVSETFDLQAMIEELGTRFEITRNYFKRHACCRYNHSALDALVEISGRFTDGRIPAEEVERVEVRTYSLAAQLCDQRPSNMLAAKFSIPFAVATFITHGEAGVDSFRPQKLGQTELQDLAKRVIVAEDAELTAMMPAKRPSRVRVLLKDGTLHEAETLLNKGDFEDPYPPVELEEKFYELMGPVWGRSTAEEILEDIRRMESIEDIRLVTAKLKGPARE